MKPSPVMRFPQPPQWMISEALRVLPPIEDPYESPTKPLSGKEESFRVYTVQKGKKLYYSGTPLPAWDGTELTENPND